MRGAEAGAGLWLQVGHTQGQAGLKVDGWTKETYCHMSQH